MDIFISQCIDPSLCISQLIVLLIVHVVCRYYTNNAYQELETAAVEQQKITEKRLTTFVREKLGKGEAMERRTALLASQLSGTQMPTGSAKSPITTHVLDTCHGRPAPGVPVELLRCIGHHIKHHDAWKSLAQGVTNADGRVQDLLSPGSRLAPGHYCMVFDTKSYMDDCRRDNPSFFSYKEPFYPIVKIFFTIREGEVC